MTGVITRMEFQIQKFSVQLSSINWQDISRKVISVPDHKSMNRSAGTYPDEQQPLCIVGLVIATYFTSFILNLNNKFPRGWPLPKERVWNRISSRLWSPIKVLEGWVCVLKLNTEDHSPLLGNGHSSEMVQWLSI